MKPWDLFDFIFIGSSAFRHLLCIQRFNLAFKLIRFEQGKIKYVAVSALLSLQQQSSLVCGLRLIFLSHLPQVPKLPDGFWETSATKKSSITGSREQKKVRAPSTRPPTLKLKGPYLRGLTCYLLFLFLFLYSFLKRVILWLAFEYLPPFCQTKPWYRRMPMLRLYVYSAWGGRDLVVELSSDSVRIRKHQGAYTEENVQKEPIGPDTR